MAGLETWHGDRWMLSAESSRRNRTGKWAKCAQLALEHEEIEDVITIYAAAAISDDHDDGTDHPKSYTTATKSPLTDWWDMVIIAEFNAFGQHQVFGDFMELPEGRKTLPIHWVYKIKHNGAGDVQRFKARLVCGGNYQIKCIDYQATFAPTAHLGHLRLALAIAAKYDLEIHQMDACTALLGYDLKEERCRDSPQGYFCLLPSGSGYYDPRSKTLRKMILHFRKSLSGMKQSLHSSYATFKDFLFMTGFVALCVHGGLFMHDDQGTVIEAGVAYVNDLIIIANEGLIGLIKNQMKRRFRMHTLRSDSFYLNMNIKRNREHHMINIHQHSYIGTI